MAQRQHSIDTLVKPFNLQMNVTSSVISLRSSCFGSSSKLLICVVLVLGLVPIFFSCLNPVLVQVLSRLLSISSSSSKLFACLDLVLVLVLCCLFVYF